MFNPSSSSDNPPPINADKRKHAALLADPADESAPKHIRVENDVYQAGERYLAEQQYNQAIEVFSQRLIQEPTAVNAYLQRRDRKSVV